MRAIRPATEETTPAPGADHVYYEYEGASERAAAEGAPAKKDIQSLYCGVSPERPVTEGSSPVPRVCFVKLSFILQLVTFSFIIYLVVMMSKNKVKIAENQRLNAEKNILELKIEELTRQRDSLNWTIGVIMKFDNFSVNNFCPQKKCQPCQTGWIHFQEKCYYFYQEFPWKDWVDSRAYCIAQAGDLVVIETLQEQKFISKNIQYYYSQFHGFWIGLRQDAGKWLWVDGRKDTLGYWINGSVGPSGSYGLMIPGRRPNSSWDKAEGMMINKFICEAEPLIKSFS